ncbi:calcium-binding protein [Microcoleus sp. C2C3]|uniref:calcium-binding protein n=1 Tax=unclassified Microcoleus TaxID=2642155 RepID=UPI002FD36B70
MTPSGQVRDQGFLDQIAQHFYSTVTSIKSDQDFFQIPAAMRSNSLSSGVTEHFPVEILANSAIPYNVNYDAANVFTGANQLQSWLATISSPTSGVTPNRFVDADNSDNLIESRPEDAAQLGALCALDGNDKILGSHLNDIVNGGAGDDLMFGASGNDLLRGGAGNDWIAGGKGEDVLLDLEGDNQLFGGLGNDVMRGGWGSDELTGGAGNDLLIATGGRDLLMGGVGADDFILPSHMSMNDARFAPRICDFNFNYTEGDRIKIVSSPGDVIRLAGCDVNGDLIEDTAILCSADAASNDLPYVCVVGVIMSKAPSTIEPNSMLMVGLQDTTLSLIG